MWKKSLKVIEEKRNKKLEAIKTFLKEVKKNTKEQMKKIIKNWKLKLNQ